MVVVVVVVVVVVKEEWIDKLTSVIERGDSGQQEEEKI